jgi:hypothetical protein
LAQLPFDEDTSLTMTRRRRYAVTATTVEELLLRLRRDKFTGKVVINMSQGGFNAVTAEDSAPVSPPQP